jgi:PAS domain S-box-containing protein
MDNLKAGDDQLKNSSKSEDRFQALFNSITDALLVHWVETAEAKATFIEVNDVACRLLGYSREELLVMTPSDIDAPDSGVDATSITRRLEFGKNVLFKQTHIAKDGRRIPVEINSRVFTFDGRPAVISLVRDISERDRAEMKLRESEDKYRQLIETTGTGYVIVDDKGRVTDANHEYAHLTGRQKLEDIIDHSVLEWTAPYDLERNAAEVQKCVEQGFVRNLEIDYVIPSGQVINVEINATVLRVSGGLRILSLCRNITDRKRAEDVLLKSERRLRRAEEVANFGNWELLLDERVIRGSDGARIIYGLGGNEWQLSDVQKIVLPEYRPMLDKALRELIEQGRIYDVEFKICTLIDGRTIDIHSLAEYDPIQRIVFGVIQDITERNRAEEELKLKSFTIDNLAEEVFWMTPNGRIWNVNEVACEKLCYTREELLSLSVADFDPSFPREAWQPFWEELKRSRSMQFESIHKTKDGYVFPIEIIAKYFNFNGLEYDCAIVRDITQHKNLEKALQASEEQFRNLCDFAPVGIVRTDSKGSIIYSNPYLEKISDSSVAELMGEGWIKLIHPEDLEEVTKVINMAIITGSFFSIDHRVLTPQGKTLWVRALGTPIKSTDGGFLGHVGTVEDITERRKAEEALRLAEKTFRDLLETVQLVAILLDREGNVTFCNEYLLNLTGWGKEEILGRNWIDLFIPYNERDEMKMVFSSLINGEKEVLHHENSIVTREGMEHLILWNNTVLHDLEGKITGTASIGIDITEQKNLEAQLRQSQKMEAVGQLAGGVAHDFNNILSAIVGYSYLVQSRMNNDDPSKDDVEQILESAHRAAEVTHSLLAFSKKQDINPKPVLIDAVVKKIEKLLSRVIGEDITISIALSCNNVNCMLDVAQIEQVLMNLANNARDAMPGGGRLTLNTECVNLDESFIRINGYGKLGAYALISVSDTGVGMSPETAVKIFEPFFTTKETGKGTGLGLAMAYGIIKQHDGYINVHSELGNGSTFNIYLPIFQSKVELKEEVAMKIIESFPSGGTETILVVEDNEQLRTLSETILEQEGYRVILAKDGQDGMEKFIENKDRIDLVLLDMIMPKKSGKDVYDEMKRINPDMKVIFVSGYTADRMDKDIRKENNLNLIFKPVSPKDLLRKVRDVLDN